MPDFEIPTADGQWPGELAAVAAENESESKASWQEASLTSLCNHIEETHHAYLKRELPRLKEMIARVVKVHGEDHAELALVQRAFQDLEAELLPHMFKEERVLFPAIRSLEQSDVNVAFPFGTLAHPIRMMEREHGDAGQALAEIRRATSVYCTPRKACNTYRAMLEGLLELEQDLSQHIHKENDILFPRALQLERSRANA
jgi:regulator of cell morphogenesis and NO signaling